ncbi:NAD(P)H-binding protein [Pseudohoeflea suaedae]|nr:NAD(P)H-binding protein [Pseudohoeflea suaedae]
MSLTIAVLGARGRLGHVVTQAAMAAGHTVLAITRDGHLPDELAGAEARRADAMKADELIVATEGADVIFNGLNPLYPDWAEMCPVLTENVIAAAKAHKAFHLFAGNVYNYGHEIPAVAGPDTPSVGSVKKGAIRIAMEARFEEAARDEGVPTTVLRAGDFYGGPGRGSWFDLVIAGSLHRHKYVWPGRSDIAHSFAYLPDLARAFVMLAERHAELPGFNVFTFSGHTITGNEMGRHLDIATGKRLRRGSLPWIALRAAGLFRPMWREVSEMSYLWFTPHALDGSKFEDFVGGFEATPVSRAVSEAVLDLKAERPKAA